MKEIQSAGGLVKNSEGKYAVVILHGNKLGLPKGHVEDNESLLEAAKREIFEETGLADLNLIKFLGTIKRNSETQADEIKNIHIFLFETSQNEFVIDTNHSLGALWLTKEELVTKLYYKEDREFIISIMNNF